MRKIFSIILSCQYAGNQVPVRYRSIFENEPALDTHRGWDIGALDIAVALSEELDLPCFVHQTTRLLVDINRSIGNSELFSEFSQPLSDEDKQLLLNKYYFPYRLRVESAIAITNKPAIHLSIQTFTPVFNNVEIMVDIGIMFDPQRVFEKSIAERLSSAFQKLAPTYRIQANEPYKGIEDGFTSYLRTRFLDEEYAGIEIVVNQKLVNTVELEKIIICIKQILIDLNT